MAAIRSPWCASLVPGAGGRAAWAVGRGPRRLVARIDPHATRAPKKGPGLGLRVL